MRRIEESRDTELKQYYETFKVKEETEHCHRLILTRLIQLFQRQCQVTPLSPFGSAVNGFGSDDCDLDLSLSNQLWLEAKYQEQ